MMHLGGEGMKDSSTNYLIVSCSWNGEKRKTGNLGVKRSSLDWGTVGAGDDYDCEFDSFISSKIQANFE